MRATGTYGELRAGYQRAARLGKWSLELIPRLPRAFVFRAAIDSQHDYWITQEPLDLVLAVGQTEWIWRGVIRTPSSAHIELELGEQPIVADRLPELDGDR